MKELLSYFFPNKWSDNWTVAICRNEDLQEHANIVMERVVESLIENNVINQEVGTQYLNDHIVIVLSNNWLNTNTMENLKLADGHIVYKIININNQS